MKQKQQKSEILTPSATLLMSYSRFFYKFIKIFKLVNQGRELVKTLLKRCEKLSRTLTQLLETNDGGLSMEKPECMSEHLTLKPYQKRGLHWLTLIHSQKISGILADEMGLGKTVQSIAFLGWLKTTNPNFTRPHLVVCPSSTLENWKREFDFWLPSFKIHTYHGEHRNV